MVVFLPVGLLFFEVHFLGLGEPNFHFAGGPRKPVESQLTAKKAKCVCFHVFALGGTHFKIGGTSLTTKQLGKGCVVKLFLGTAASSK